MFNRESQKKKILHIQLLPLLSGVQNAMLHLITNLSNKKYEFFVLSAPKGPLISKLKQLDIKNFIVPDLIRKINPKDLIVFYKFYRLCRKYKFDLVHTHSSKTGFLGRIAAKLAGIPAVVHTVHGFPFHEHQSKFAFYFYKILEKVAGYFCDKIVSVNKHEWKVSVQSGLVKKDKMTYVYNGIEDIKVKDSKYAKANFGFPEKSVVFGSVSRFHSPKNNINLVKAAIKAIKIDDCLKFVFIGDGKDLAKARNIINQSNMQKSIILPGWHDDIEHWLAFFDVFVLYSYWEGLSLSIIEALSAGLPVIASDIKGNNELVEEGLNGKLVNVNDTSSLVNSILDLSKNPEKRIRMGERSRKIFEKRFTLSNYVNNYRKIYESLIPK